MKTNQRAVTLQMKASKHKTITKAILAMVAASMIAGLFSFIIDRNTIAILKDAYKANQSAGQEYIIAQKDLNVKGLSIEGHRWVITDKEPEITINNINQNIDSICIDYCYGDNWKSGYNLFWTNDEAFDFEENFTGAYSDIGKPYVLLPGGGKANNIKIRLGKPEGKELQVEGITINPELRSRLKENLHKSIVYKFRNPGRYLEKFKVLFILLLACLLPFVVGWNRFFKDRWLVGLVVLIFIVANQYNGDSLAVYDTYIQPGEGSEYVMPIIGEARHVRSDEWAQRSPAYLSTEYLENISDKNNFILRGTDTVNEYALSWFSVYDPFNFLASLLRIITNIEYAYSFKWYSLIVFTLLINIDFFLLITGEKKLLSFTCAIMVVLSSHYLWWVFPAFVTALPSLFVCANGFIKSKKLTEKYLWSTGIALSAAYYVLNFYPAWQVPVGYLMIPIFIWFILDNREAIKKFSGHEWIAVGFAVVMFCMIATGYLLNNSTYIKAMTQTVYPGKRFSTGGFDLYRMFNYLPAGLFSYKNLGNPSAESTYLSLFPLPLLMAVFYQHRNKWKNSLVNGLLVYSFIILIYTTIGFPSWLAKITLISYSPGHRAAEVLAYSEIILFAAVIAVWKKEDKIDGIKASVLAAILTGMGVFFAEKRVPNYMTHTYIAFVAVLFFAIIFVIVYKNDKGYKALSVKNAYIALIVFSLISGALVRPVTKGLDSIYSKPLYKEIRAIMEEEPNAKWITQGALPAGFLIACGAPCINSCNYYPNIELWSSLDEKKQYYNEYNRFEYVEISLVDEETQMENPQPDLLHVKLSYKDLKKTSVDYIATNIPIHINNDYVKCECIYEKSGSYIYKTNYK